MHYFRQPQTLNEKRAASAHECDGLQIRGKRNVGNLVDSFDDIHIAAREDRSWKRFRKTRWRESPAMTDERDQGRKEDRKTIQRPPRPVELLEREWDEELLQYVETVRVGFDQRDYGDETRDERT